MKAKLEHISFYKYNQPVFLESQEIRLCPRNDNNVTVVEFNYKIEPEPQSSGIIMDGEGNSVIKIWFNQRTDFLNITTSWTAQNINYNPYNFIIHLDSIELPAKYCPINEKIFSIYRNTEKTDKSIINFSNYIKEKSDNKILLFLNELTGEIYNNFTYEKREDGAAYPPEYTLKYKVGACRDISVLFMECCRCQGIAARYVSGYRIDRDLKEKTELHAWVEVYIEGAGWKGFDPSLGLAVTDEYFAVAASYLPAVTMPIFGTFRSNTASSELKSIINPEIL